MARNLKCVIIDDDPENLSLVQSICKKIEGIEVEKMFSDPDDFLFEADSLNFDFCLLDIDMPGINGIEVARKIKNKHVVFVTAHSEFAPEAFDLDAVDFVRKPVSKTRLKSGIEKVKRRMELSEGKKLKDNNYKLFNTDKGKVNIKLDHILYFGPLPDNVRERRDKRLILEDGAEIRLKNIKLEVILEYLPKDKYSRVNNREIISHSIIGQLGHDEIIPRGEIKQKIPYLNLSSEYSKDLLSKLN